MSIVWWFAGSICVLFTLAGVVCCFAAYWVPDINVMRTDEEE